MGATPEMILGVTTAVAITFGLWYFGFCVERILERRRQRRGPGKFRWVHRKEM